jgi:hypothetical protein
VPAKKKREHDRQNAKTSPSTFLERTKSIRLEKKRISLNVNDKTQSLTRKHIETSNPLDEKSREEAPPVNQGSKGLLAYISELEEARLHDEDEIHKLKGQIKLLFAMADENAALKLKIAALEEELLAHKRENKT